MTAKLSPYPLQSRKIGNLPFVRHGITRRVAGLGLADGNISYSEPRNIPDAWEMRQYWCEQLGIDPHTLVTAHQVHGRSVGVASRASAGTGSAPGTGLFGQVDSLVTGDAGTTVMMTHADCLALIVCDPQSRAVGVIHAGWRGTVANVSGATVNTMIETFDSAPEEILVFIGPGICKNCYAVGEEVVEQWTTSRGSNAGSALTRDQSQWHFDIVEANRQQLLEAGVRSDAIEFSGECTRCNEYTWFSHRAQGPTTGRFASIVSIVE